MATAPLHATQSQFQTAHARYRAAAAQRAPGLPDLFAEAVETLVDTAFDRVVSIPARSLPDAIRKLDTILAEFAEGDVPIDLVRAVASDLRNFVQ